MYSARRGRAAFVLLASVILGLLFRDAIVHGYVLGQGELLLQFEPWRAARASRLAARKSAAERQPDGILSIPRPREGSRPARTRAALEQQHRVRDAVPRRVPERGALAVLDPGICFSVAAGTSSVTMALSLVAAAVLAVWAAPLMPRRAAACLPAGLIAVDLFVFADGFHPLKPRETTFPPLTELEPIQNDRALFRVGGWGDTLIPNSALVYGFHDYRGYDGVGVRQYGELLDVAFRHNGSSTRSRTSLRLTCSIC
jgi:hypothetical protein